MEGSGFTVCIDSEEMPASVRRSLKKKPKMNQASF